MAFAEVIIPNAIVKPSTTQ